MKGRTVPVTVTGGRAAARGPTGEGPWTRDLWPVIHAERKALATDLQALDVEQWQAASLCGQWTIRDVTAHMTATAKITPPAATLRASA
jgi:Mycothiol maleylpyruvate isomerase N-terminal domain